MLRSLEALRLSVARIPRVSWVSYTTGSAQSSPKSKETVNVPGLSDKVLVIPQTAVGPGASKSSDYKNPEYFSYDKNSYFEAEIEMAKFRLPQPSSLQNNQ